MSSDQANIFYLSFGAGDPVIVIHDGPGLDHTYLMPFFEPLTKHYQLIFYDQRATGQSGGNATREEISIERFVTDLEALRKGLNLGKVHLLGHSWGALLALKYATMHAENLRSLILLHPMPPTAKGVEIARHLAMAERPDEEQEKLRQMATSEDVLLGKETAINDYFALWFRAYFADERNAEKLHLNFGEQTARNSLLVMTLMLDSLGDFNLLPDIALVKTPALLIQGSEDIAPMDLVEQIHVNMPQSEQVVVQDVGHFSFIEAPEQLFPLIETFLQEKSRR